jgi:F-type H+-transporting ATPase subunit delta
VKQTILARRYAKALFMVGKEKGVFSQYNETLRTLKDVYQAVPDIAVALANPMYPLDLREKLMDGITASLQVDKPLGNFLRLVVQKKRAAIIPDIAEEFAALVDAENNVCQGHVVSAIALNDDTLKKVRETLAKLTGKDVQLTTSIDTSIIGGIIAKVGDLVLDGSIRTQIAGLKDSIKGRE